MASIKVMSSMIAPSNAEVSVGVTTDRKTCSKSFNQIKSNASCSTS